MKNTFKLKKLKHFDFLIFKKSKKNAFAFEYIWYPLEQESRFMIVTVKDCKIEQNMEIMDSTWTILYWLREYKEEWFYENEELRMQNG